MGGRSEAAAGYDGAEAAHRAAIADGSEHLPLIFHFRLDEKITGARPMAHHQRCLRKREAAEPQDGHSGSGAAHSHARTHWTASWPSVQCEVPHA